MTAYALSDFRIERRTYSVGPWRVVHIASGKEVAFPRQMEHPHLGRIVISGGGFRTKREAEDELAAHLRAVAASVA